MMSISVRCLCTCCLMNIRHLLYFLIVGILRRTFLPYIHLCISVLLLFLCQLFLEIVHVIAWFSLSSSISVIFPPPFSISKSKFLNNWLVKHYSSANSLSIYSSFLLAIGDTDPASCNHNPPPYLECDVMTTLPTSPICASGDFSPWAVHMIDRARYHRISILIIIRLSNVFY